jgi:UDP-GlcNAc:undecaprenyl-phosphate GlcNAc-1-phosphate transferase
MYSIFFLMAMSFACCLLVTPMVRIASQRRGMLDQPGARKLHTVAVPRTGGVAIAAAYVASLGFLLISPLGGASTVNLPLAVQLLPAAGLVFAVGLLDDVRGVRAWQKLGMQIAAACLAYWSGVQVDGVAGYALPEWLSLPLTVVWLVGCSNAFNLIDGMDGLATGIGLFATFTILAAAMLHNNVPLAIATAPLVGALLAFLRYNFNPASIFLGDSGSLTIGFVLGCFGAIWSQKSATLLGMTAPLMALSVPLLDTGVTVIRRFIRRQPIFSPDRNHLHHRLLDRGMSPRRVALIVYGACGLAAAFSLIQTTQGDALNGVLLVMFCATAWAGIQLVGYVEFDVAKSLVLTGAFRDIVHARMFVEKVERDVGSATTPDEYWSALRHVNRELGFGRVRMLLAGKLYEDDSPSQVTDDACSSIRIPLRDQGYVNFRLAPDASVRHAVAITSIVNILQRSIVDPSTTPARPGPDTVAAAVAAAPVPPRAWAAVGASGGAELRGTALAGRAAAERG